MTPDAGGTDRLASAMRRAGTGLIVALAALRATTTPEILPWFDSDPFSPLAIPMTGPGPAGMLLMDVLTILSAALVLWGEARDGRRIGWWALAALLGGAAAVLWHALPGPALDDLRIGATWLAAVTGAFALAHAARDPATRRLAAGVLMGAVVLLVARSLLEYTVEHDRTVANFDANRDAILESRGWTPDSPMARAFERRLRQREASGWFGLTNVHATVLAGMTIALLGLAWAGLRGTRGERPELAAGWPGVLVLAALGGGVGLGMTHSRGGLLAAAIGLVALVIGAASRKRPELSRWTSPGALALVGAGVVAVLARAALGTRIGELSLLFRWFYLKTAAVVFADHPIAGVGPAGFQQAYQLHKPPVSPEDVAMPHNLLLALAATLGLGGILWGSLWALWIWRAGRQLSGPQEQAGPVPGRPDLWFILLAAAGPTLLGAWLEQPAMTPELALVRITGLLGWVAVAWAVVFVSRAVGGLGLALAAGAIASAAQCMIDMGATFQASACLVLAMLGVAAPAADRPTRSVRTALAAPAAVAALALVMLVIGLLPVWRWQRHLTAAGRAAYAAAQLNSRVNIALGQRDPDAAQRALEELGRRVGLPPAGDTAEFDYQFNLLYAQQAKEAARRLEAAANALDRPHEATQRALSQTLMRLAAASQALGQEADAEFAALAAESAATLGAEGVGSASAWAWLAVVRDRAAEALPGSTMREGVVPALQRAVELNPYNASLAFRLMTAHDAARNEAEARRWAAEALRLDELSGFDPDGAGLTESQRERAARLAGGP